MNATTVLVVAGALIGIGLRAALAQQTFVMVMMGIELMVNGVLLAGGGAWALMAGGGPKGQVLVIVVLAVMAVEMVIGFALVVAVYRARQADSIEGIETLRG